VFQSLGEPTSNGRVAYPSVLFLFLTAFRIWLFPKQALAELGTGLLISVALIRAQKFTIVILIIYIVIFYMSRIYRHSTEEILSRTNMTAEETD
jgi:hypothetical protein